MRRAACALLLLLTGLLQAGCAGGPRFDLSGVDKTLMPAAAAQNLAEARGRLVYWGGSIVATTNLKDSTRIEVLAYPLDRRGLPDSSERSQGRFVLIQPGYLEAADYAPGRLLSVLGKLTRTHTIRIGEAQTALAEVEARQLYLWPPDAQRPRTRFHFGLGVGISR